MRASLGTTLALVGALGAIGAGSLTATASAAETYTVPIPADTFQVVSAAASAANPDQVTVVVDSVSTIASLSAEFSEEDYAGYDQVLTLASTATDPTGPAGSTQTTWTANLLAGSSGLPLGTFSIALNGTFADSGTYSQPNAGLFGFLATSTVTLAASNTNLRYPNGSTTLSGQVTLTNPDGTPDTDYSSANELGVTIILADGDHILLPISSDGTFSDPDFTPAASGTIQAQVAGEVVQPSLPASIALTVTTVTPTLSLKVNPVTETYGKPATVTGSLSYTSGSASAPVAGQQVWVNTTKNSADALATAKTTGNGGFSITLPERAAGGPLYVGSTSATDLAGVVAPLTLKVVHPTEISSFKTSLSQYWGLSVSGCLGFPAGDKTERIEHTAGLTVQYESSPKGPWKKLGAISGNESDRACGTGGIKFSGSFAAPENYAYYRVVYAGTAGATGYAATNGNAVLAWRYADRITGLKVSPTVVNAGGKLTVKGTLQYYYGGWHNYGGQTILIDLHPQGSNPTWYWLVKVKTNSKGQFSSTFKDPVSATWRALFEGNDSNGVGHLAVGSSEVYVRLK